MSDMDMVVRKQISEENYQKESLLSSRRAITVL